MELESKVMIDESFCRRARLLFALPSRSALPRRPPRPAARQWHSARETKFPTITRGMARRSVCRTDNPMCKGTGRTRSRITTTGPTRRAAFLAIRRDALDRECAREQRAPSRVSDPVDGEVPFQPWARAVQQEFLANFHNPTKPEYIEPLARCAPAGVPKSFTWHGFEIRQYPHHVLFLFNSGSRIIYLDGRPHLPDNMKLWNADSRGRWEGNTLIVDVTNNNAKARLARTGRILQRSSAYRGTLHLRQRRQRYNYVARSPIPRFTRAWTATIPTSLHRERRVGRLALRSCSRKHSGRQTAHRTARAHLHREQRRIRPHRRAREVRESVASTSQRRYRAHTRAWILLRHSDNTGTIDQHVTRPPSTPEQLNENLAQRSRVSAMRRWSVALSTTRHRFVHGHMH